jgi:hypothetical protein
MGMTAPAITNMDPRPGTIAQPFFPYAAMPVASRSGFSGMRELANRRIDDRCSPVSLCNRAATIRNMAIAVR